MLHPFNNVMCFPFSGKKTIAFLRKLEGITRVICVSNNLKQVERDLLSFANMEKKSLFEGLDPLIVKSVIPVDLAPYTLRYDMVVLCEKLKASELPESKRKAPKPTAKKPTTKNTGQKKRWRNSGYGNAARSNFFPTVEMVRNYTGMRRPKQDIDFQKRDSLYPVPLRGALYQGAEEPYYPQRREYSSRPYDTRADRFMDFRRDLQDALEDSPSSYAPPKNVTTRKLAYANALLEEGIRMASEVLDGNSYTQMPPRAGYYDRPSSSRYSSSRYRY